MRHQPERSISLGRFLSGWPADARSVAQPTSQSMSSPRGRGLPASFFGVSARSSSMRSPLGVGGLFFCVGLFVLSTLLHCSPVGAARPTPVPGSVTFTARHIAGGLNPSPFSVANFHGAGMTTNGWAYTWGLAGEWVGSGAYGGARPAARAELVVYYRYSHSSLLAPPPPLPTTPLLVYLYRRHGHGHKRHTFDVKQHCGA